MRPRLQLLTLKKMGSHKNGEVNQDQKPIISHRNLLKRGVSTLCITMGLDVFSHPSKAASLAY